MIRPACLACEWCSCRALGGRPDSGQVLVPNFKAAPGPQPWVALVLVEIDQAGATWALCPCGWTELPLAVARAEEIRWQALLRLAGGGP